jgi:hypothetical protein
MRLSEFLAGLGCRVVFGLVVQERQRGGGPLVAGSRFRSPVSLALQQRADGVRFAASALRCQPPVRSLSRARRRGEIRWSRLRCYRFPRFQERANEARSAGPGVTVPAIGLVVLAVAGHSSNISDEMRFAGCPVALSGSCPRPLSVVHRRLVSQESSASYPHSRASAHFCRSSVVESYVWAAGSTSTRPWRR